MTNQPTWGLIVNLGDAHPIDYGGYFVYRDTTGVYQAEAEKLFVEDEDDYATKWTVHRIVLDRCKEARDRDGRVYLVPFGYTETWTHHVSYYDEWFHKTLSKTAEFIGLSTQEMRNMLCSEDEIQRAIAYEAIYDYHGWYNGDSYPLQLTRKQVTERYGKISI